MHANERLTSLLNRIVREEEGMDARVEKGVRDRGADFRLSSAERTRGWSWGEGPVLTSGVREEEGGFQSKAGWLAGSSAGGWGVHQAERVRGKKTLQLV